MTNQNDSEVKLELLTLIMFLEETERQILQIAKEMEDGVLEGEAGNAVLHLLQEDVVNSITHVTQSAEEAVKILEAEN